MFPSIPRNRRFSKFNQRCVCLSRPPGFLSIMSILKDMKVEMKAIEQNRI